MTPRPSEELGRPKSFYRALEKSRAGFGAAGLAALLAEAVISTRGFIPLAGGDRLISYLIIGVIALAAFIGAAVVVDVPEDTRDWR